MHGARRVITFCLLTAVLPTVLLVIPLYLRHSLFADVSYSVSESDVLEAVEGISSVFCQEQILRMNSTFRAFQLEEMPLLSNKKKHIQLKKSMVLPDDTVEYWGFYLLAGSNISLLACSRFEGAGVLVVKGDKNLKTCHSAQMQHKSLKYQKGKSQPKWITPIYSQGIRQSKLKQNSQLQAAEIKNESSNTKEASNKNSMISDSEDFELSKEIKKIIKSLPSNKALKQLKNQTSDQQLFENLSSSNLTQNWKEHNLSESKDIYEAVVSSNDSSNKYMRHKRAVYMLTKDLLDVSVEEADVSLEENVRLKRKVGPLVTGHVLDAGVGHGGNANVTEDPEESSDSSFEESLKQCYSGQELSTKELYPTSQCHPNYSLNDHKVDTLYITSDGYYYFIFYSDNDHVQNPVHAHFDIYKTTYEHANFTQGCVNQTECRFPISFLSREIVIVEVPTHDGIEHEDGDASVLISSCYPRMSIYAIFPVAVLFLILVCAFL